MTRERRVSPAVSSASAARVRSTSRKPNAVKSFLRRVHRERADAGQRVEQRREEQLLVDRAHDRLVPLLFLVELLERRARRDGRGNPSTRARCGASVGVGRKRVGLVLVDELQAVLDRAQPHVGLVEPARVAARLT